MSPLSRIHRGSKRRSEPRRVETRPPKQRAKPRLRSYDPSEDLESDDLAALDELEWRSSGPYDIGEVEDVESTEDSPKIDLGSVILTAVPGSELRLQVAEETGEIVSAMLVIETIVEPPASANQKPQTYSSALELGAYAAPRSGASGLSCAMKFPATRRRRVARPHSARVLSALSCGGSSR